MGYGLGMMAKGIDQGLSDRKNEIRQEESDEFIKGEREHTQERRAITEGRQDDDYQIKEDKRAFDSEVDGVLREYMTSNGANFQSAIDLYNDKFPDGQQISATRNADGTFEMLHNKEGGDPVSLGKMNFDQFGQHILSMKDPEAYMKYRASQNKPMKGRFSQNGKGQVLDTTNGKTVAGSGGADDDNNISKENAEKFFSSKADKAWGSAGLNGITFGDKGKARSAENARLAWEIFQKQPSGQKSLTSAHETALTIIQAKKEREDFSGDLPGSTDYIDMNASELQQAAQAMKTYFPDGTEVNEKEMREFMSSHNVPKAEDQNAILQQLGIRSTGAAKGLPNQKQKTNEKPVKLSLPKGMSKEQVFSAATKQIREGKSRSYIIDQMKKMGLTNEELNKAGF